MGFRSGAATQYNQRSNVGLKEGASPSLHCRCRILARGSRLYRASSSNRCCHLVKRVSKAIDGAGEVASAEPVIDINHAYVRGAAVQHRQKSGQAPKAGSITRARGHCDDRNLDQSAADARQSAFRSFDSREVLDRNWRAIRNARGKARRRRPVTCRKSRAFRELANFGLGEACVEQWREHAIHAAARATLCRGGYKMGHSP